MSDLIQQPPDSPQRSPRASLAPPDYCDAVIEAYKRDVDRTLLRENLKLTVEERFRKFESLAGFARELHDAGERSRSSRRPI